jgi:hypothetical protein
VVIEVVVNLDVVGTQFGVVGEDVVEGDGLATLIHLAVDGVGYDTLVSDDGLLHILRIIRTAARTKCAQQ